MFIFRNCTNNILLDIFKEYCFTFIDGIMLVTSILIMLYKSYLILSYVNLIEIGHASKAMNDQWFAL